jgi:hypothetical protein
MALWCLVTVVVYTECIMVKRSQDINAIVMLLSSCARIRDYLISWLFLLNT